MFVSWIITKRRRKQERINEKFEGWRGDISHQESKDKKKKKKREEESSEFSNDNN